jgi:hypothetical protein
VTKVCSNKINSPHPSPLHRCLRLHAATSNLPGFEEDFTTASLDPSPGGLDLLPGVAHLLFSLPQPSFFRHLHLHFHQIASPPSINRRRSHQKPYFAPPPYTFCAAAYCSRRLKDRNGEPERGGSEWESIKILLKNSAYEPDLTRAPLQASLAKSTQPLECYWT